MSDPAFSTFSTDRLVFEGKTYLNAVLLRASVDGGDITLYEGMDPTSGRKFCTFLGLSGRTLNWHFSPAIPFDRGLYVDIGSNITEVTIVATPTREG